MENLDVLVIENRPGVADHDTEARAAAGHRVHRCHDDRAQSFPCRVLDGGSCPVDDGVDVALVVRRGVTPHPSPWESGVSCVLRAGVPLVEAGLDVLDPYEPYLASRVAGAARACEAAVGDERAMLVERLHEMAVPLVEDEGALERVDELDLEFERAAGRVRLTIIGPALASAVQNRLAVRMLDALRALRSIDGRVDVAYRAVSPVG
jgi:hypothetical protein